MNLVTLSAVANILGANTLILGYLYLRHHGRHRDQWFINFAFLAFVLFMASILICTYEINIQPSTIVSISYPMFSALLTIHLFSALFLPVLIVFAAWVALTGRLKHYRKKLILYWIFPVWMIASLTGVVMYISGAP